MGKPSPFRTDLSGTCFGEVSPFLADAHQEMRARSSMMHVVGFSHVEYGPLLFLCELLAAALRQSLRLQPSHWYVVSRAFKPPAILSVGKHDECQYLDGRLLKHWPPANISREQTSEPNNTRSFIVNGASRTTRPHHRMHILSRFTDKASRCWP